MQTLIANAEARDGRPVLVRRVTSPDSAWAERVIPFLGHKGAVWNWQLEQLLRTGQEGLSFNSYLADLAPAADPGQTPQIVSHICTIESQAVGLFGHVYTLPSHRGLSLARILTQAVVNDFRSRGGLGLWLVTDYDSTPYRAYRQFGFQSITPGDGIMTWFAPAAAAPGAPGGEAAIETRFAPGQPTHTRPVRWRDYATLNALACSPAGPPQRSVLLPIVGRNIVEWSLLAMMKEMQHNTQLQARLLVTESDWPVGWAICKPNGGAFAPFQEPHPSIALDLFAHPNFRCDYAKLLASVRLPADRKILSRIDSTCPARQQALAAAGFVVEGRLTNVFPWNGKPVDLIYMARNP